MIELIIIAIILIVSILLMMNWKKKLPVINSLPELTEIPIHNYITGDLSNLSGLKELDYFRIGENTIFD